MEKIFRSRGFGFYIATDQSINAVKQKVYYEADTIVLSCILDSVLPDNTTLSFFEFAENENGEVSSLNFHVDLMCDYSTLYSDLDESLKQMLKSLPQKIGNAFLNYTVGYRIKNLKICGKSYYFYPTIFRESEKRYGIKGITDKKRIIESVERFLCAIGCKNGFVYELRPYLEMIQKLKGVCVSVSDDHKFEYKIYGRIEKGRSSNFMKNLCAADCEEYNQYGDIFLTAIRFSRTEILGYNSYYFK